jgi:hypothetical protein
MIKGSKQNVARPEAKAIEECDRGPAQEVRGAVPPPDNSSAQAITERELACPGPADCHTPKQAHGNSLPPGIQIQTWPIDRLVFYARNPRKNDAVVDRMCSSIREFGFKCPVLARSDGEVVDGHLRLKAARKLEIAEVPVILCDEWTLAQVKAFRLVVHRSVTWADWDDELLTLELQELAAADFDLSLTGFDPKELDDLLAHPDDGDQANTAPPLPEYPVSRAGDLWLCGNARHQHRVLCGDATDPAAVARLLAERRGARRRRRRI